MQVDDDSCTDLDKTIEFLNKEITRRKDYLQSLEIKNRGLSEALHGIKNMTYWEFKKWKNQ